MSKSKKKHKFKMPSAFTILFLIIIIMAVLSWIIPAGAYQTKGGNIVAGSYHRVAQHPQGLWDIFMAPIIGMIGDKSTEGAISISLFILVIGGFLAVVNKTKALDQGIGSIVSKYKGKEKALIPILMILFALGGTTFGMSEETIAFYPLLIPVMISCGFDSMVALGIIIIGSQVGCLASTVNPFATGVASQSLGISPGDGLVSRVILLVITLTISIIYVYHYASKIEKDPKKSVIYDQREADYEHFNIADMNDDEVKMSKRQKRVITVFILTFVIMIFGLIPWDSINKHFTFFNSFTKWLTNLPVLGTLVGKDITPFGSWYFSEITMLFFFMAVLVKFLYNMSEEDFVNTFLSGMADFISVAMVVAVARGIQVIMNNGMITGTILHWGELGLQHLSSSAFSIIAYIFYIPMSFLIPSTSGLASATMGIIGPLGEFAHVAGNVVVTAFQAASGWVNLITPTSAVIMGALAIARVDISKWWKWISKLMVILFVVTCIYLGILAVL